MLEKFRKDGTPFEILMVEDGVLEAEILRRSLVRAGYRVLIARNGEEGLEVARQHRPDLVVSDIQMPLMDGYQLCHALKYDDELWAIPVILLTMLSEAEDIMMSINSGADGYITKPFVEQVLLERIRSLLLNPNTRKRVDERRIEKVEYNNAQYTISGGNQQILNLLLSVYENSLFLNRDLIRTHTQLEILNDKLESQIAERTASLRESEQKLQSIFDGALDGIALVDIKTRQFMAVNPAFCEMLGYGSDELSCLGIEDIYLSQDFPYALEQFEKQWRGEIELAVEVPVKRKDGSVFYADIKGSIVQYGKRACMVGVFRDVSEFKQAQEKLRESEAFNAAIINSSEDCIKVISAEGILKFINSSGQRLLEICDIKQFIGKFCLDFWSKEDQPRVREAMTKAEQGGIGKFQAFSPTVTGKSKWWDVVVSPIREENGEIHDLLTVSRDITEQKNAESQLNEQLEELRRWQLLTEGRELRAIELKREINELLSKSGQPPRYPSAEQN